MNEPKGKLISNVIIKVIPRKQSSGEWGRETAMETSIYTEVSTGDFSYSGSSLTC